MIFKSLKNIRVENSHAHTDPTDHKHHHGHRHRLITTNLVMLPVAASKITPPPSAEPAHTSCLSLSTDMLSTGACGRGDRKFIKFMSW